MAHLKTKIVACHTNKEQQTHHSKMRIVGRGIVVNSKPKLPKQSTTKYGSDRVGFYLYEKNELFIFMFMFRVCFECIARFLRVPLIVPQGWNDRGHDRWGCRRHFLHVQARSSHCATRSSHSMFAPSDSGVWVDVEAQRCHPHAFG